MASPRSRQAARLRASRRRAQQRARRVALLVVVGSLAVVTLLLTAFGSGGGGGARPAAVTAAPALVTEQPTPQVLATVGNLRIQLPVAEAAVTAIGFHGATGGALTLTPLGRQANEGLLARLWRRIAGADKQGLSWYQLDGGAGTQILDVGAKAGTDVYAPVDGTVAAITDQVRSGRAVGSRIDIRPTDAPSVVVSLANVEADPALTVGSPVLATSSKLGTVANLSAVERQALARWSRDTGDNASIEVHPAASSLP